MDRVETCYICKSSAIKLYREVDGFQVYKCRKCGLKWVNNNLKQVDSFYNKEYFKSNSKIGYRDYLCDEENHRRNARDILNIVNGIKDLNKLKILDVGCAFGFFLDEAKKIKHCDVYGVELSSYAYEYVKNNLELHVLNSEISDSLFVPNFFDAVFMLGTIEHLRSPGETFSIINKVLKSNGILVITTIDTAGLLPLYSIKPPEHLFYFNHHNLSSLLNSFGFRLLLRKTNLSHYYLHDLLYRLGKFFSLSFIALAAEIIKKNKPAISIRIPTNEMILIAGKS